MGPGQDIHLYSYTNTYIEKKGGHKINQNFNIAW